METFTFLLTIFTADICLYYFILNKLFHFWRLKIPHVQPLPFLGNMVPIIFQRLSLMDIIRNAYYKFSDAKYFCVFEFTKPIYIIRDLDLINVIGIKSFNNFLDRSYMVNDEIDPMGGKNLFFARGDHWRKMRKTLTPSFTCNNMKMMFELMCHCAKNFSHFLLTDSGKIGKTYDMQDVISRYATDVIATCAFGINVNFFSDPKNEFFLLGKGSVSFTKPWITFKFIMHRNFPKLSKFLKLRMLSAEVNNFFRNIITETIKIRKEEGIIRPNMIQLMMESRNKDHDSVFNIDEMTAQAFSFFFAGFETVTKNMCFALHELAVNPDIQSKLREEIEAVLEKTKGKPTYEAIKSMKYLNAVVSETLRFYPPGVFLDRLCVKKFELPPATSDSKPVILKPGDNVWFPVHALHHDSKYYSEPEKFNPDRFLNNEVDNSVYMPFGIGPRICIGSRFALMEEKIMLFYLLWHCDLEPDIKTIHPIVQDKKTFILSAEGGFWLKVRAR